MLLEEFCDGLEHIELASLLLLGVLRGVGVPRVGFDVVLIAQLC